MRLISSIYAVYHSSYHRIPIRFFTSEITHWHFTNICLSNYSADACENPIYRNDFKVVFSYCFLIRLKFIAHMDMTTHPTYMSCLRINLNTSLLLDMIPKLAKAPRKEKAIATFKRILHFFLRFPLSLPFSTIDHLFQIIFFQMLLCLFRSYTGVPTSIRFPSGS